MARCEYFLPERLPKLPEMQLCLKLRAPPLMGEKPYNHAIQAVLGAFRALDGSGAPNTAILRVGNNMTKFSAQNISTEESKMKKTKRILSLMLVVMMTVGLFTVSVSAATSTSDRELKTQVLFALGLFKGYDETGTNFGLADGATREHALLFLIRMLGEEKAAAAWTGAQPYSDVASGNYFYPYIGYAKAKGYTNGIGDNKFGLGQSASMVQMAAFALRGLGYSEAAGDFTYPNSLSFAVSLGILDTAVAPATFTRGDAVDIIDGAVAAKVKNQNYTLLDKLVSSGAVTQAQVEKAAAIANGNQPQSNIAAGTYTLKCMGNSLRVTSNKMELRDTSPAQIFTITNKNGYSYIQTAEGYYIGVTSLANGTQLVAGSTPYFWLIQKQSGTTYTLRPAEKTGMVVNASEEKSTNGTKMIIWTHSGAPKNTLITFTAAGKNVAVTGVKLDQTTATVAVGKTTQLTGTISPTNATNQDVTWSSSAPTIAKVDANGKVTGVKVGTATITVKTADGSKTATCKVTVTAADTYVDKKLNLYNSTNKNVTDIRISSTQNSDWGSNLTSGAVKPDASVAILIPVSTTDYTYDIAITYADGSTATYEGYNFKNFTSGGSLYAYIDASNKPILSTTKPAAANTTADSAKLLKRYNQVVERFNATQEQLRSLGLFVNQLKTDWETFAKQLNSNLGFIGSGRDVYTVEQITTANAILDEVDKMLNEMDQVIAEAKATAPTTITVPIGFVNNTGVAITGIFFSPSNSGDWGSSMGALAAGETGVVKVNIDSNSLRWDLKLVDGNGGEAVFNGLNFSDNNAKGITITLTMSGGSVKAEW